MLLFLQGLAIYFIISYSKYHQAAFGNKANKFTGGINKQVNKITYFFHLSRTNDSLVKANEILYNKLKANYSLPDSANKIVVDSIMVDSMATYRKFEYLSAKVVSNSVSSQANFMVLNGPNVKNFVKGMAVVGVNNDAVGIVTEVAGDYAVVMSMLHKDSHLSGKLLRSKEGGTINWDGKQTNVLNLSNIPNSAKVAKGDTIITSGLSSIFPKGILIGKVLQVTKETTNNNFNIQFEPAADFYGIEYVYAIKSADAIPVKQILEKAKATVN